MSTDSQEKPQVGIDQILTQLQDISDKTDLETEYKNTSTNEEREMPATTAKIPEEQEHYALSYYQLLSKVDQSSIYHRSRYYIDSKTGDQDDIVALHQRFLNESDYSVTLAIGPDRTDTSRTTLYLLGLTDSSANASDIAASISGDQPVDFLRDMVAPQVLEKRANKDLKYIQFPVVSSEADIPSDLDEGQAVYVGGERQDLYVETA